MQEIEHHHRRSLLLSIKELFSFEYISNVDEDNAKTIMLSLKPVIIETTGFDKNVTFSFADKEIIGRFSPNSGVELNKSYNVYSVSYTHLTLPTICSV